MPLQSLDKNETWGFDGDDMVSRVARAMYGNAVVRSREHTAGLDLGCERISQALQTALNDSDRSAAILIFALIEDLMLDYLKRYLSIDYIKGGWDEVIGGNGLLATANDRITLISLLGWIRPVVYNDLRLLKSIRNRFAHHAQVDGFVDSAIQSWIASMKVTEESAVNAFMEDGYQLLKMFSPRQKYLMRASMIVTELLTDLAIAPNARQAQVAPGHVSGSWDDMPENIKEVRRLAVRIIGEFVEQNRR